MVCSFKEIYHTKEWHIVDDEIGVVGNDCRELIIHNYGINDFDCMIKSITFGA